MAKTKHTLLEELKEKRDKIALDLVDIYWTMKPPKKATEKKISEVSSRARIEGERGKIGMKAIEQLDKRIAELSKEKPASDVATLSNDEIQMLMEYRKNGKARPASRRGKA